MKRFRSHAAARRQIANTEGQIPKGSHKGGSDLAQDAELARIVMERIEALGRISDEEGRLTRTFGSKAMRKANDLVGSWMRAAGMEAREDAIGNVIGNYRGQAHSRKTLLIGSHLDTVRDAGRFDGALGVLVGIACVQKLMQANQRLRFAIEVVGFADEEGVRFQSAYLGSKAMAGTLNARELKRADEQGVAMAEAIRGFGGKPETLATAKMDPQKLLGYVEAHIEQGPRLEQKDLAVGVVSAIAGQTRARVTFRGQAAHAGTTPMKLRRDALCAAAEFILAAEGLARKRGGLVATVGELRAIPGAGNVIPGQASLSLDVRHSSDRVRMACCARLKRQAQTIARRRKLRLDWQMVQETAAVNCNRQLSAALEAAVQRHQKKLLVLPSGAGHDAAVMAAVAPIAMLFVRCKGGLSHHPDESASPEDVRVAIAVLSDFVLGLVPR